MWLAGVDGCAGGWIAAFVRPAGDGGTMSVFAAFADLLAAVQRPTIIAVDMPIGLPERAGHGGREAENAVRPLLGARQSSVFSVPSRAAIEATSYPAACAAALASSEPPRKVSKQLFNIGPKIREVDELLRGRPALAAGVFEVHPELAFWRLNGERPLAEPKKIRAGLTNPVSRCGGGCCATPACRRPWFPRRRRKAPASTISLMRWPARPLHGAFMQGTQGPILTRRHATPTDCQWRSGRK
jgi:predicted RNase H-like nuclease